MPNKFKLFLGATGSIVASLAPLAAISLYQGVSSDKLIVFENKLFSSYEEAMKYFMNEQKSSISKHEVVGSLSDATIDNKFNMLNKNMLPDYDPAKIQYAYLTSNGNYISDPNIAVNSFARPQDKELRYTFPGAKKSYATKGEAQKSLNMFLHDQIVSAGNISLPSDESNTTNPNNNSLKKHFINPTNKDDVNGIISKLKGAEFGDKGLKDSYSLNDIYNTVQDKDLLSKKIDSINDFAKDKNGWKIAFTNKQDNNQVSILTNKNVYGKQRSLTNSYISKYQNEISRVFNGINFNNDKITLNSATVYPASGEVTFDMNINLEKVWDHDDDSDWNAWPYSIDWYNEDLSLKSNGTQLSTYPFREQHHSVNRDVWVYATDSYRRSTNWWYPDNNWKDYNVNDGLVLQDNTQEIIKPFSNVQYQHMNINPLLFNKLHDYKVNTSNSSLIVHQYTRDAGGAFYRHAEWSKTLYNVKFRAKIDLGVSDILGYNVLAANKNKSLGMILTYENQPMFEVVPGNGDIDLKNISSYKVNNNILEKRKFFTQSDHSFLDDLENAKTSEQLKNIINRISTNNFLLRVDLIKQQTNGVVPWQQEYLQYLNELKGTLSNDISGLIGKFVKPSKWLVIDNEGNRSSSVLFKNNFVYSPNIFNPPLLSNGIVDTMSDLSDATHMKQVRKDFSPVISGMWVFYDANGLETQKIDEGSGDGAQYNNARFDNLDLMRQNIINSQGAGIDGKFVYVNTDNNGLILVKNIISNIYLFKYNYSNKYFRSFDDLKSYIIDYIKSNSYLTGR